MDDSLYLILSNLFTAALFVAACVAVYYIIREVVRYIKGQ